MYTIEETMNEIRDLEGWGDFVDQWDVADRTAIVWSEQAENKHGSNPWRTIYIVRYWENDVWLDTKFFGEEWHASEFARDFVNGPHRLPYPTD